MKKLMVLFGVVFVLLCLRASPAHAFGLGLFGNFDGGRMIWEGVGTNFMNYGGGLVLDTNLASDQLFNYRMELGFTNLHSSYQQEEPDIVAQLLVERLTGTFFPINKKETYWENSFLLTTIHYFGFGVVRTKTVRFWLGPQLTIGGMLTNNKGFYAGLGLALGLNINIGEVFTLSITGSGRYLGGVTFYKYQGGTTGTGGYGGDGMVTLAFIFRIPGDTYKP